MITIHNYDDIITPLNYDVTTQLNYEVTTPLNYDIITQLNYEVTTPLNYDIITPLNYDVTTPLNYDIITPLNYDIITQLNYDVTTPPNYDLKEGDQARLEKGRRIEEQRYQKERKAFITLTYIIFSYLLCWLPFHFVFDISAISADLVPTPVYMFTFWLTYFNSTLNPLIYAYSNRELKEVFRKVIRCQFG